MSESKIGVELKKPEIGWKRIYPINPKIQYDNLSLQSRDYACDGNNIVFSTKKGGSAKFNVLSDKIRLVTTIWSDGSDDIELKIDGKVVGSISCYKPEGSSNRVIIYENNNMGYMEHFIELTNNKEGKYFYFDSIDIDENGKIEKFDEECIKKSNSVSVIDEEINIYPNVYTEDKNKVIEFIAKSAILSGTVCDKIEFQDMKNHESFFETDYINLNKYTGVFDIQIVSHKEGE